MFAIPTDASRDKAETARRNGALSRGPVTPEGKARSARNASRHGICARTLVPADPGEAAALAELRAAFLARWQPMDAAEANLVEELVFAAWRQVRLRAVEDAVLARAQRGQPASPDLPSLATLIRYRARLARDAQHAADGLRELRRRRDGIADPAQLRWLAERIDHALAIAAAHPPPDAPAGDAGTNEPTAAIVPVTTDREREPDGTNESANGMNEPRYQVPPLPAGWQDEPGPPLRGPNRHHRRRLAALHRQAA